MMMMCSEVKKNRLGFIDLLHFNLVSIHRSSLFLIALISRLHTATAWLRLLNEPFVVENAQFRAEIVLTHTAHHIWRRTHSIRYYAKASTSSSLAFAAG